jgi:hypothetical protein
MHAEYILITVDRIARNVCKHERPISIQFTCNFYIHIGRCDRHAVGIRSRFIKLIIIVDLGAEIVTTGEQGARLLRFLNFYHRHFLCLLNS